MTPCLSLLRDVVATPENIDALWRQADKSSIMTHVSIRRALFALLVAAFTDLRSRKIGNWLNAAIALGAPLFWWASGLGLTEIALQIGIAAATLAVLAVLFALRAMGGGDVKLLTALALWIEPMLFLKLIIAMSLIGGLLVATIFTLFFVPCVYAILYTRRTAREKGQAS